MNKKAASTTPRLEPVRRLSIWRVFLALLIIAGLGTGSVFGMRQWHATRSLTSPKPWFAAYVDVTATPTFAFENMGNTADRDAVLSFIVSSPSNACTPTWGSAYSLSQASGALDLDRRIARLQQQGGSVAVSFGGRDHSELAVKCTNPTSLLNAYRSVIDRYNINTIDLDLESGGLTNTAAGVRRAEAIATLQTERRAANKALAVWVTLPVTPQGLSEDGTNAVSTLLAHHVDLAGVNIMTMDYYSSLTNGQGMLSASKSALTQTVRQLSILYERAGMPLNNATLWSKLGTTPMIGQNDDPYEIFTLSDAQGLNRFARLHHISRTSMWSANRDLTCGSNYVNTRAVSDSCSGINQGGQKFANLLSAGFKGDISLSASLTTKAQPAAKQTPDNPATSPYQVWSPSSAYLEGTKVVWHHNVYQAKWWTQGDSPAAASSNPDNSPWAPLTQAQVNEIKATGIATNSQPTSKQEVPSVQSAAKAP